MSSKISLILAAVTVVLLACAALFQILEMNSYELFPVIQERVLGKSASAQTAAPAKEPAAEKAEAAPSEQPAKPAEAAPQGGLFPGKKAK